VINRLTTSGVGTHDAALIASAWIYQNLARLGRSFAYGADFPATDPDCASSFHATFAHRNWTDGEDVVQAAPSATDDGFNGRFQKIQADIAALGAEVAKIYGCVATMRSDLAARLEDVRVELNRIDADVAPRPPIGVSPTPGLFGGLVENTKFLGLSQVANQTVSLWHTDQGVMVLPTVGQAAGDPSTDPGVKNASALAGFASSSDVQGAFANKAFSPSDFVTKFGQTTLSTGVKVADVVANLPSTAQFASVNDLVSAVGEQQSRTLAAVPGVPAVFAPSVVASQAAAAGAAQPAPAPGSAPITSVTSIPADQRAALAQGGITTVAQLANADQTTVSKALQTGGLKNVATSDIATSLATAKILTQIHTLQ
jgi:predicted flap endonuclease-1-like 5' DNA nuclease